jgi:hypothetical protein
MVIPLLQTHTFEETLESLANQMNKRFKSLYWR